MRPPPAPGTRLRGAFALASCLSLAAPMNVSAQQYPAVWADDGVPVCTNTAAQNAIRIASDGQGGVWVVWDDNRNVNSDVFLQQVLFHGVMAFPVDEGFAICTEAGDQLEPAVQNDGASGAFIAWEDRRATPIRVYTQYVLHSLRHTETPQFAPDGEVIWTTDPPFFVQAGHVNIVSAAPGVGMVLSWYYGECCGAFCDGGFHNIRGQKFDTAGTRIWGDGGSPRIERSRCPIAIDDLELLPHVAVPNGSGGALATWQRTLSGSWNIYAKLVASDGSATPVCCTERGLAVSDVAGHQTNPQIATNAAGGGIICWEDARSGTSAIYAQWVFANGTQVRWTDDGELVASAAGPLLNPAIAPDGSGGAWIGWEDHTNPSEVDLYLQHVDIFGDSLGSRIPLCTASHNQGGIVLVEDDAGGVIAAWWDERDGLADIYAQHVTASGTPLWTADGVGVCTAPMEQNEPQITTDGSGGAIVVWRDLRAGFTDPNIYAQRLWGKLSPTDTEIFLPRELDLVVTPHPIVGTSVLQLRLPRSSYVSVTIYDVSGRLIRHMIDSRLDEGVHPLLWDRKNQQGRPVQPGVYFVRARGEFGSLERKVVVMH